MHPFSKSNQGKWNLNRYGWHMENPKIFFRMQNRKQINKKMKGLISQCKLIIWISYWTIKTKHALSLFYITVHWSNALHIFTMSVKGTQILMPIHYCTLFIIASSLIRTDQSTTSTLLYCIGFKVFQITLATNRWLNNNF